MADTVTNLIARVKDRISVPADQERYTDADIVELLQEETDETVFPFLIQFHEEFFVVNETLDLLDSNGDPVYKNGFLPIPKRAYGRMLRDVMFVDDNENRRNVPQIAMEDRDITVVNENGLTYPVGFYLQNDMIKLIGDPDAFTGNLELPYIIEPPTYTTTAIEAHIYNATYSSGTTTFTLSPATPYRSSGVSLGSGDVGYYDIIRSSTGAVIKAGVLVTNTAGVITTTSLTENEVDDLPNYQQGGFPVTSTYFNFGVEVFLVPQGFSNRSLIPAEADSLLVAAVACRILEGQGDTEGLATTRAMQSRIEKQLTKIYGDRVIGESRKVVNRRGIHAYMRRVMR